MLRFSILAVAAVLLCVSEGHATTWTVSNDTEKPAQFTNLQAALDAASPGDTLLITATPTDYGFLDVTKAIHLIGEGIGPEGQVKVSTVYLKNQDADVNASGSVLEGLDITSRLRLAADNVSGVPPADKIVESVVVRRCRIEEIDGYVAYRDVLFEQCLIDNFFGMPASSSWVDSGNPASTGVVEDIRFRHCIFNGASSRHFNVSSSGTNVHGQLTIQHCLFLSTAQGLVNSSYPLSGVVFENSMFIGTVFGGVTDCVFNHCLAYAGDGAIPEDTNSGSGNVSGDPNFSNYPASPTNHDWSHDYTLTPGAPGDPTAIGTGTFGEDIGIGGGAVAGFDGNLPRTPRGPVVTAVDLPVTAISVGGTLQISVSAESRD